MRFQIPGNAWHVGARKEQQDAFGFSSFEDESFQRHGGTVAVVADGMGGMVEGRAASNIAKDVFLGAYGRKTSDETIPGALSRSLHQANREVVEWARRQGLTEKMGTTLTAVVLADPGYHLVAIGDSPAYLARQGQLYLLNRLHTRGADLDRQARAGHLPIQHAKQDPNRDALTTFLGLEEMREVDGTVHPRSPIPARPGDRIILCSDGLSNALNERQILGAAVGDPQEAAERLVHLALARSIPNQDNLTVLVIASSLL